mmetsp:Transcript_18828/g.57192  ORF Transcript_18828/g.57192 Transcript_18828/m.57192 type:complete len:296 (-) Transcript_18828:156-1043(-)
MPEVEAVVRGIENIRVLEVHRFKDRRDEVVDRQEAAPAVRVLGVVGGPLLGRQRRIGCHPGGLAFRRGVVGAAPRDRHVREGILVPGRRQLRRVRRPDRRGDKEGRRRCLDEFDGPVAHERRRVVRGIVARVRNRARDGVDPGHVVISSIGRARLVAHPVKHVPARRPALDGAAGLVPAVRNHRWRVEILAEVGSSVAGPLESRRIRVGLERLGAVHTHAAAIVFRRLDRLIAAQASVRGPRVLRRVADVMPVAARQHLHAAWTADRRGDVVVAEARPSVGLKQRFRLHHRLHSP